MCQISCQLDGWWCGCIAEVCRNFFEAVIIHIYMKREGPPAGVVYSLFLNTLLVGLSLCH